MLVPLERGTNIGKLLNEMICRHAGRHLRPRTKFRDNACNSDRVMADELNSKWPCAPITFLLVYQSSQTNFVNVGGVVVHHLVFRFWISSSVPEIFVTEV